MSAVTVADWPAAGQPFTVADLDRLPDDGRRYELLDGVLIVSPRPIPVHQWVADRLFRVLDDACPFHLGVMHEPGVEVNPQTEFAPDLVVIPVDEVVGVSKFTAPPLLVVEIRSPSTALIDLNQKKRAYERFGVPSYWIVGPDLAGPEFTVFELRDGRYELELKTTEPFTASRPFPVSIVPASLTSRLRLE
jgi:Uma2 family endonuclease